MMGIIPYHLARIFGYEMNTICSGFGRIYSDNQNLAYKVIFAMKL